MCQDYEMTYIETDSAASALNAGLGGKKTDIVFARSLAHAYWHGSKDDRSIAMVLHDAIDEIIILRQYRDLDEICNRGMQQLHRNAESLCDAITAQEGSIDGTALQQRLDKFAVGDLDGGTLQELAEKHGMLKPETRHEPCGGDALKSNAFYEDGGIGHDLAI